VAYGIPTSRSGDPNLATIDGSTGGHAHSFVFPRFRKASVSDPYEAAPRKKQEAGASGLHRARKETRAPCDPVSRPLRISLVAYVKPSRRATKAACGGVNALS
jgi:hypothetical protein